MPRPDQTRPTPRARPGTEPRSGVRNLPFYTPGGSPRRLGAAALAFLATLALVLPPSRASAHPFGRSYYSHRIVARLDGASLRLDYAAEVPTQVVMRAFYQAYAGRPRVGRAEDLEFLGDTLTSLASGIEARVDGRTVPLTDRSARDRTNGKGDQNFFRYKVALEGALPLAAGARAAIEVRNRNHEGLPAYFSLAVRLPEDVVLVSGNVQAFPEDERVKDPWNLAAAWSGDPEHRTLSCVVRRDRPGVLGSVQRGWRRLKAWAADDDGADRRARP